ncbi:hypothetical protein GCM10027614_19490 [Micromonospora vulcania]
MEGGQERAQREGPALPAERVGEHTASVAHAQARWAVARVIPFRAVREASAGSAGCTPLPVAKTCSIPRSWN